MLGSKKFCFWARDLLTVQIKLKAVTKATSVTLWEYVSKKRTQIKIQRFIKDKLSNKKLSYLI